MKLVAACLVAISIGAGATGQDLAGAVKPASRATISGIVVKDPGSEPVKKALIELIAENQAEGGAYSAVTGADGLFHIEGILPGRYRLFAERTGFLEVGKRHARSEGRMLTLAAGQEAKELQIRLQAMAVVRGRVTDEDGDPMPNAEVGVLHQTFASGHNRWEQVGSDRTNDLGEYRIANLAAGSYCVFVNPPPDFKSLIEAAGAMQSSISVEGQPVVDSLRTNASSNEKAPSMSYQTTYYPGTADRGQASPIQLHAGDDFPVNFSLTETPTLSIRGSVVNLPPRVSATIMLQSRDFNMTLNGAETRKDGSFVIRDVAPGAYTIFATVENGGVSLMARQPVQVVNSVDGVRLTPQPGAWIHGRVRFESKGNSTRFDAPTALLALHAADGDDESLNLALGGLGFGSVTQAGPDGSFEWKGVPPGNYALDLVGGGADWYLKSVYTGNRELGDSGLSVNGGAVVLDLVASANGAIVEGAVTDAKGKAMADSVVVAVPEARLRGRADRYRKTVADQSGRFSLHAVPPGDYTLFAWESIEGDGYLDPEFLKSYDGRGIPLHVGEGERKSVQVQAIAAAEEQE